jgi:hypothetical protein
MAILSSSGDRSNDVTMRPWGEGSANRYRKPHLGSENLRIEFSSQARVFAVAANHVIGGNRLFDVAVGICAFAASTPTPSKNTNLRRGTRTSLLQFLNRLRFQRTRAAALASSPSLRHLGVAIFDGPKGRADATHVGTGVRSRLWTACVP